MKKHLLISLSFFLFAFTLCAQSVTIQISGHVTEQNTNLPVANHPVYIISDTSSPSSFYYYNVLGTDNLGYYEVFISLPANQQVVFTLMTPECNGGYQMATVVSTNAPIVANFSICTGGVNPCSADFTYFTNPASTTFQFADLSTGNPTNWQWSFGDGNTSVQQNPTHTYANPGAYQVCLTIWGINCQSTYCDIVYVGGSSFCQASFYAYPDSNAMGNTLHFVDMSMGNPTSWFWDFGDNTTSNQQFPVHTYAQAGYYMVCLTIADSNCTSTYCDTVMAGNVVLPCNAVMTFNTMGLTVYFNGIAWGGIPPYSYAWDFGDGNSANLMDPFHTYAQAGTYNVTLTIADAAGCSASTTATLTVSNTPQQSIIWGHALVNNSPLDHGFAYLYLGSNVMNTLSLVDSTIIDTAGYYSFFLMNPLPGLYFVKVAPTSNSVHFATRLPTYYGNTIFWANATPINLLQVPNPCIIDLVPLVGPVQGGGNINGQVTNGGAKIMLNGTPAPNVEVMLLDPGNDPLSMDYSDAQGFFSFPSLAMGTYKVYAEVTGLQTTPAIVTLTTANPAINTLPIVITPNGIITGIIPVKNEAPGLLKLYPNPAAANAVLELSLNQPETIALSLFNLLGEKLSTDRYSLDAGTHLLTLALEDMRPGIYTVQLIYAGGLKQIRKITVVK